MLHFETKGQGLPVVFLHGYLENAKMWKDFVDELSQTHQVVLIDLPGHGNSENYEETHTMELMSEKVKEVLDFLEISKSIFVGHSMGGYVTLAYAELFPEDIKAFVLMNSTTFPDSEEKKEQRLKAVETARKNLDTLIKMSIPTLFAEHNLGQLKPEIEFTKKLARETSLQGVTAALKGMRLRPDRGSVLNEFQGKAGILIGKYDKAVNPEVFKKAIPQKSNISILELETGHMAHLEAPKETMDFIKEFIRNTA